ncbi:hypothetical protein PEL8287_01570 [Roseovarius litorisediminis]|uniref:Uncharacterized protein n=1 Tax=Roseovarius litorisediminis TaxID=1312363 RepID=A0A1Y5S4Y5_9RHOB|nr:hypothetical protein PEL8287_01570 [Roseovarius litorisediminis]
MAFLDPDVSCGADLKEQVPTQSLNQVPLNFQGLCAVILEPGKTDMNSGIRLTAEFRQDTLAQVVAGGYPVGGVAERIGFPGSVDPKRTFRTLDCDSTLQRVRNPRTKRTKRTPLPDYSLRNVR